MARVIRDFAPEPPVVFVILSETKYLVSCFDYPLSQPPPRGGEMFAYIPSPKR